MAGDQPVPGLLEPRQVDRRAIELAIGMAADLAQLQLGGATDQIGLLDVGQREGCAVVDRRLLGAQAFQDGGLLGLQPLTLGVAQDPLGRAQGQLLAVGRQADAAASQIAQERGDRHITSSSTDRRRRVRLPLR